MSTWWPMVRRRKCLRSLVRCQGSRLSRPMPPRWSTAAMWEISIGRLEGGNGGSKRQASFALQHEVRDCHVGRMAAPRPPRNDNKKERMAATKGINMGLFTGHLQSIREIASTAHFVGNPRNDIKQPPAL